MPHKKSDSDDKPGILSKLLAEFSLTGRKDRPKHSRTASDPQRPFVGGFKTEPNAGKPSAQPVPSGGFTPPAFPQPFGSSPGLPPRPPPVSPPPKDRIFMPEPTHFDPSGPSLTTQYALDQYYGKSLPDLPHPPALLRPPGPDTPVRPHSDSDVRTNAKPAQRRGSTPSNARPPRPSPTKTPKKSQDALSVPDSDSPRSRTRSSPSSIAGAVTCSGTTKSGEPCKNTVKRPTALGHVDSDADQEIERYCHLHIKEVLKPSGFQSSLANEWVSYDDWIPAYLQEDTRAALRHEMNKRASPSDRDGYIYTFEIRDQSAPGDVHLKVGRTVNLVKRIDQWSKQCESKEQVLRGFWPGDGSADTSNLMKGRVKAGNPGKYCYRLERLIHLELADLMHNKPYLLPGFPKLDTAPDRNTAAVQKRKCPDCGKTHKEIFTFQRYPSGKYKGKEYEVIVKSVVEKWGKYVEKYVDGPAPP